MKINQIIKKDSFTISLSEAKKILGVSYQNLDDKIILALIKELEYLSEIALGFP